MIFSVVYSIAIRSDRHRLAGICLVDSVPGKKLVGVMLRTSMTLVAAKYSDPTTGAFELAGLPEYPVRSLLVCGLDEEGEPDYNAAIVDFVSQVTGV